ncbi:MAG: nucleotidyl transferase AbiEii/AbiGii toxin family protein [Pseudomonadota bacterium]
MFEEILARTGACLDKNSIPYVIIGGQALLLYGEPRLTRDIDMVLGIDIDELDRVVTVVKELGLRHLPEDLDGFVNETMVLPAVDETTGIRVDFIFSLTPYELGAIKRANKVRILGQEISFAAPEDVIIHKIFAGRPRDMEDIRSILLKNPSIEVGYVRGWLKEFDAASDEKAFQKAFDRALRW